jgi:hypothetical protein
MARYSLEWWTYFIRYTQKLFLETVLLCEACGRQARKVPCEMDTLKQESVAGSVKV